MSPEEGKGAANDFPGCTDDPQHGLLVSGLAHRTPHWDAQGQYRFCGSTVTVLTAHIALIESSLWECLTKSASMSLCFMYNEIASSEQIVGVVFFWGYGACKESTATVGCIKLRFTEHSDRKKKNRKRNDTNIHDAALTTWHHWPINVQHAIPIPRAGKVSTYSLRAKGLESDRPRAPDCNGQPQVSSKLAFRLD